ncbi:MAG: type VI secretion system baseplate subunit TssE [Defluviimonas sp.]|nr:type VI secretion system baseplate subunit TssE [Defluviimonas sp.]
MKKGKDGYFQVSLMNVFREAAESRDARSEARTSSEAGETVLSVRTVERREGTSQARLREHLAADLANLLGTTHLESTLDLSGLDRVRKSVLNYGVQDMTRLTTSDIENAKVLRDMRAALIAHEPRLIAETVQIKLRRAHEDAQQRIAFDISAEMSAKPVDVPLEFIAEIDVGAGKVSMSNLLVRG